MDKRPSWDAYFLDLARQVGTRATCRREAAGCVLVIGNRLIATGYTGAPSGQPHCLEVGCEVIDNHCTRSLHAEANAVAHAPPIAGITAYVTRPPCPTCALLLASAGVTKIITG
ncbi:MAG: deoxycytidylate deaminase [Vulcanimicrobiaceae bacterium]